MKKLSSNVEEITKMFQSFPTINNYEDKRNMNYLIDNYKFSKVVSIGNNNKLRDFNQIKVANTGLREVFKPLDKNMPMRNMENMATMTNYQDNKMIFVEKVGEISEKPRYFNSKKDKRKVTEDGFSTVNKVVYKSYNNFDQLDQNSNSFKKSNAEGKKKKFNRF